MPDFAIRAAEQADRAQWEPLWRGYLEFYRVAYSQNVTDTTWRRFFDVYEPVHALVAERNGKLLGLAHYVYQRNTWLIDPQCYLQDLFVAPDVRGAGLGRALIAAVVAEAGVAGSPRVVWLTHETNATARRLYDAVAERSGMIQYRILLAG
jgi:GNAT superfamily N-acetyltransferase